jgi:hypothetical protein
MVLPLFFQGDVSVTSGRDEGDGQEATEMILQGMEIDCQVGVDQKKQSGNPGRLTDQNR